MSRVAGAYSRASGHDPAVDLLEGTDHPRGDALSEFNRATAPPRDEFAPFEPDDGSVRPPPGLSPISRSGEPAARRPDVEWALNAPPSVPRASNGDAVQRNLSGLVDRVFLPIGGEPIRSVAFASIGPAPDSGPLAAAAAEMLAERTSRTVCLVDANFRTPSLHMRFGLPGAAGFAEALALDAPLVESAQRLQRNLWVVPAGVSSGAPLFSTAAARMRLSQFVAQFDYMIVNVEPVHPDNDAAALLRLLGGVIVVIAADATRREAARRATQTLAESGATVIGAVLTNRRFPIPDGLFRLL